MSKCIGCGVLLQSSDPDALGYLPELILIEKGEQAYCKRCHDLRHYNKESYHEHFSIHNKEFLNKIKIIKQGISYLVLIIDILDPYGGMIEGINELVGNKPLMIIANKIDLLPKSLKRPIIEANILAIAKQKGLNPISINLISAFNEKDIEQVMRKIAKTVNKKASKIENIYLLGAASVGKSTLMNGIIKLFGLKDYPDSLITTSARHQTTLDLIKIPLGKNYYGKFTYIIDTPGYVSPYNIASFLSYESAKKITPQAKLRVRTFQLRAEQTIFLAGLARIDFIRGENISASFFVANELVLHRTKLSNIEKIKSQIGTLLAPPLLDEEKSVFEDIMEYEFTLNDDSFYDLMISGLGFIHLKGDGLMIKLSIKKNIFVHLVPSFITG